MLALSFGDILRWSVETIRMSLMARVQLDSSRGLCDVRLQEWTNLESPEGENRTGSRSM